jgi:hypothetical protein
MSTKVHPVQAIHDLTIRVSHSQLEDLIADCDAKLSAAVSQLKVKHRNGSTGTAKLYVRIRDLSERRSSLLRAVDRRTEELKA